MPLRGLFAECRGHRDVHGLAPEMPVASASEARPKQAAALPVEVPLAQFGGAAMGAAARSGALAGVLGAGPNGASGPGGANGANGAGSGTGATRRDLGPFGGLAGLEQGCRHRGYIYNALGYGGEIPDANKLRLGRAKESMS